MTEKPLPESLTSALSMRPEEKTALRAEDLRRLAEDDRRRTAELKAKWDKDPPR